MKTTNDNKGVTISTKKDIIAKVNSLSNTFSKKSGAVIVNAGMAAGVPVLNLRLNDGTHRVISADERRGIDGPKYVVLVNDEIVATYFEIAPNRYVTNVPAYSEIMAKREERYESRLGQDSKLNGHEFDVKSVIKFIRQHKGWRTVPMKAMELTREGGVYLLNNTTTRNKKSFTLGE